jgi:hypothetical protein
MAKNRMAKLRERHSDPFATRKVAFDAAIESINEDDPIRYVIETMKSIPKSYTEATFEEGERVKVQLDETLNFGGSKAEFRYQGSVTNDTHIKFYSDVDLLVIDTDFVSIEPPKKPASPYKRDPLAELKQLRADCTAILKKEFPAAKIDTDGGKCVSISGGSLHRTIDVVIANWWNTVEYQRSASEIVRGVKVFDAFELERIANKPFFHNELVDKRDKQFNGNLRRVCRYLKSEKYDAELGVSISSYDIVSIAWNMPDSYLVGEKGKELALAQNARTYLRFLLNNDTVRNSLTVPNGMRKVFGEGGAAKSGLLALYTEVNDGLTEVEASLAKTYRRIQDARVVY